MSSENERGAASEDSDTSLRHERLDYAWKWFDYHAKQRVSMFNFFLIASGLFATAYVDALCKDKEVLGAALSFLGMLIALVFVVLDCRNARLVYLGEDILRRLERDELFVGFSGLNGKLKEVSKGILYRDSVETEQCRQCWKKHQFLLKFVEILVAISFLVGCIYALHVYFDP